MRAAFMFPGQGSQAVGMGQNLRNNFQEARDVFAEVDAALGQNLSQLISEGPIETLTLTENTQPALLAVSIATLRVVEREAGMPIHKMAHFVAGHSLGEYSALAASGALGLSDAAKLLKIRGRAMQDAVPTGVGAMAAILGLTLEQVADVVQQSLEDTKGQNKKADICTIANDNAAGQVVVSGHANAVDQAIQRAKAQGARGAVLLPVSAPFHCPLMQPAADIMQETLAHTTIVPPTPPVIANIHATPVTEPEHIRTGLVDQICGRVRWRESVMYLADQKIDTLVELGAGKVLTNLTRRIDKNLTAIALHTAEDITGFLQKM